MSIEAATQQQIQQLTQLANGMNPEGGQVTLQQRLWAGEQLRKIKAEQEVETRRRHEVDRIQAQSEDQQRHKQALDKDTLQLQAEQASARLHLEATIESRKLDLEAERVEIAKAEVVLRALEIAARNPNLKQLTEVVGEMSFRLLGGEMMPAMLEDKTTLEEGASGPTKDIP